LNSKYCKKLRELTLEKQEEVLHFVDSLTASSVPAKKLHGLEGLWADLDIDITEEDIAQARREMWGNFPRDIS
jgi:hypothetical protein